MGKKSRPYLAEALRRDLLLEAGFKCAMPGCGVTAPLERAHLIDFAKTQDDRFGNQIMLCRNHHGLHGSMITTQDLRVLKARLAWERDRYTPEECMILSLHAQHPGTDFVHPTASACCIRHLISDGYVEAVDRAESVDPSMTQYRMTELGRYFTWAWRESGALHHTFNGANLRPRKTA